MQARVRMWARVRGCGQLGKGEEMQARVTQEGKGEGVWKE